MPAYKLSFTAWRAALILLSFVFSFSACKKNDDNLANWFSSQEIKIKVPDGFRIEKTQRIPDKHHTQTVRAHRHNERLHLKLMTTKSEATAQEIVTMQKQIIFNLFNPSVSPYPGQLSEKIDCPQEMKPKLTGSNETSHLEFFSDSRLNLGVCHSDSAAYKVSVAFLFSAENQMLIQMEHYARLENPQNLVENVIQLNKTTWRNLTHTENSPNK